MKQEDRHKILKQFEKDQEARILMDDFNCRKGTIEYKFTEFVVVYLGNNGGKGRIDQIVLNINGLNYYFSQFIEYQKATDNYYVEVIKENKKYIKLKLTDLGIGKYNQYFDNSIETKNANIIVRFIIGIIQGFKYTISLVKNILSIDLNNFIKFLTAIVLILSILEFLGISDYTKIKPLINRQVEEHQEEPTQLNNLINQHPTEYSNYLKRGDYYYDNGALGKALSNYNDANKLAPLVAKVYNNRGNVYYDLKDLQMALKDYNQAIELDPTFAVAFCNRANLYFDLKRESDALHDYSKAIEINPKYSVAHKNRADLFFQINDIDNALSDYGKAVELNPQFAAAYNNRAKLYYHIGEEKKALMDYNLAIKINPNYVVAYENRATLLSDLGQHDQSKNDLEKAKELRNKILKNNAPQQ